MDASQIEYDEQQRMPFFLHTVSKRRLGTLEEVQAAVHTAGLVPPHGGSRKPAQRWRTVEEMPQHVRWVGLLTRELGKFEEETHHAKRLALMEERERHTCCSCPPDARIRVGLT